MTVKISKPALNIREELSNLKKPSGVAGETMLRAETPQEQQAILGVGRKNIIINGDMRISQRRTSSLTVPTGTLYHSCDRWLSNVHGTYNNISTIGQNLNSVSPPPGFANYLGLEVDTATTVTGDLYYNFRQIVEGYNMTHLNFGSSNAKTITVSFWVRSSLTGDFSFSLRNRASDRNLITTYTINAADTWEYKTIIVRGDTAGTWDTDNGIGMTVNWGLGNSTGAFSSSTLNKWQAGNMTGATTGIDWVETLNANWYITGVQIEIGKTATPFEHRSYGEELALCQRYYYRISGGDYSWICEVQRHNTDDMRSVISLPVALRIPPTISQSGLAYWYNNGSLHVGTTSVGLGYTDAANMRDITQLNLLYTPTANNLTNNGQTVAMLSFANTPSWGSYLAFDSEL